MPSNSDTPLPTILCAFAPLSPTPLTILSLVSLLLAALCALIIAIDVARHKQQMWIMNLVWPITGLYAGPLALWAYFRFGRLSAHQVVLKAKKQHHKPPAAKKPYWQTVALAATHCGSGCTLADIAGEWTLFYFPLFLLGKKIFGSWLIDFILAFAVGILFQYFTIVPMRNLTPLRGILAAVKADALSLTAWQVGMYGWMAIATFVIFRHEIHQNTALFWFMMQIAMLAGFLTAYPVNAMLLRFGVKETM